MNPDQAIQKKKPILRGVSHQVAAYFAAIAGAFLIYITYRNTGGARVPLIGNTVYVLTLVFLFGMSAFYHRPTWKPAMRRKLRKLDHAAIYFLIAGTGTAVGLASTRLSADPSSGFNYLVILWVGCTLGVIKSLFWAHAPKAISALAYCLIGLSAAPFLPQIAPQLGMLSTVLICIGGALYLVGAVIYALRKPDPWPEFFGYHEIFHLLVIAGATCHYIVILRTLS